MEIKPVKERDASIIEFILHTDGCMLRGYYKY